MKQLKTQNSKEVTVNTSTGEAYISQRKAAEKLGMTHQAIQQWCLARKYDVKQGLSSEIFSLLVTHYALDSKAATQEAKELLRMVSQAGAKAYLYHEAGYSVSASPVKPMALPIDYVSALRALADETEQKIILLEENTEKRIETDASDHYFTVKKVRTFNQGMHISGITLVRKSEEMNVPIKQTFDLYDARVNSYHYDVWLEAYPDVIIP